MKEADITAIRCALCLGMTEAEIIAEYDAFWAIDWGGHDECL